MKALIYVLTLLLPLTATGGNWTTANGSGRVQAMVAESGTTRITLTANDFKNTENCQNYAVVILVDETPNGDRQYSALLSALVADLPVKIYTDGCYTGWGTTYPNVTSVTILKD